MSEPIIGHFGGVYLKNASGLYEPLLGAVAAGLGKLFGAPIVPWEPISRPQRPSPPLVSTGALIPSLPMPEGAAPFVSRRLRPVTLTMPFAAEDVTITDPEAFAAVRAELERQAMEAFGVPPALLQGGPTTYSGSLASLAIHLPRPRVSVRVSIHEWPQSGGGQVRIHVGRLLLVGRAPVVMRYGHADGPIRLQVGRTRWEAPDFRWLETCREPGLQWWLWDSSIPEDAVPALVRSLMADGFREWPALIPGVVGELAHTCDSDAATWDWQAPVVEPVTTDELRRLLGGGEGGEGADVPRARWDSEGKFSLN